MFGVLGRNAKSARAVLLVVAMAIIAIQPRGQSQELTYSRGQSVLPLYQGYMQNADGSFDLHFGYLNKNWLEEVDVPVGPENNIAPASMGPDAGQPTHFLPRQNRWQFMVHVPADWGSKEVVWTLTSHGQTTRAYGVLKPGYILDDYVIQHEFGSDSTHGRKPPVLKVEGDKRRTAKVGQPVELIAVATDDNPQRGGRGRGAAAPGAPPGGAASGTAPPQVAPPQRSRGADGPVGGDSIRTSPAGLRLAWYVYRGAGGVRFDPPMAFKVWEDQRGGSPWAPGWQPPPIPPGNKWVYNVTFQDAGTYVLRVQANNGSKFVNENVTFNVTP